MFLFLVELTYHHTLAAASRSSSALHEAPVYHRFHCLLTVTGTYLQSLRYRGLCLRINSCCSNLPRATFANGADREPNLTLIWIFFYLHSLSPNLEANHEGSWCVTYLSKSHPICLPSHFCHSIFVLHSPHPMTSPAMNNTSSICLVVHATFVLLASSFRKDQVWAMVLFVSLVVVLGVCWASSQSPDARLIKLHISPHDMTVQ